MVPKSRVTKPEKTIIKTLVHATLQAIQTRVLAEAMLEQCQQRIKHADANIANARTIFQSIPN